MAGFGSPTHGLPDTASKASTIRANSPVSLWTHLGLAGFYFPRRSGPGDAVDSLKRFARRTATAHRICTYPRCGVLLEARSLRKAKLRLSGRSGMTDRWLLHILIPRHLFRSPFCGIWRVGCSVPARSLPPITHDQGVLPSEPSRGTGGHRCAAYRGGSDRRSSTGWRCAESLTCTGPGENRYQKRRCHGQAARTRPHTLPSVRPDDETLAELGVLCRSDVTTSSGKSRPYPIGSADCSNNGMPAALIGLSN